MAKVSKRYSAVRSKVDRAKLYPAQEALELAKACATAKFKESVDVAVQLGIDAKKSDQLVRGSIVLPAGTGKTQRVAELYAIDDMPRSHIGKLLKTELRERVPAKAR